MSVAPDRDHLPRASHRPGARVRGDEPGLRSHSMLSVPDESLTSESEEEWRSALRPDDTCAFARCSLSLDWKTRVRFLARDLMASVECPCGHNTCAVVFPPRSLVSRIDSSDWCRMMTIKGPRDGARLAEDVLATSYEVSVLIVDAGGVERVHKGSCTSIGDLLWHIRNTFRLPDDPIEGAWSTLRDMRTSDLAALPVAVLDTSHEWWNADDALGGAPSCPEPLDASVDTRDDSADTQDGSGVRAASPVKRCRSPQTPDPYLDWRAGIRPKRQRKAPVRLSCTELQDLGGSQALYQQMRREVES